MANINFYLHNKQAKNETQIILSLSADGKRIKVKTGEKIAPKYWNAKKQIAKSTYSGSLELNAFLQKFGDEIMAIYRTAKIEEIPISAHYIKSVLSQKEKEANGAPSFLNVLEQFIDDSQAIRTSNTIRNYKTFRGHLQAFLKATKYELTFETVNNEFRDSFHKFLIRNQGQSDSTVSKTFSILKRFMTYATERGYNQSSDYLHFKFRERPATKIALTQDELNAIEDLDLSDKSRLEKVRDIFVFGCHTSLRHSDILSLRPENIKTAQVEGKDVTYIDLIAHKTRGEVQAPLRKKALAILNRYKDKKRATCFPVISNQKFNDYIKEVGKMAEINSLVEVVRFVGGKRTTERVSKYQLIASHTARRTFVTHFFEKGGSVAACMVYTGHKNYKELETYRKKTLQHKLKIATNPFGFSGLDSIG